MMIKTRFLFVIIVFIPFISSAQSTMGGATANAYDMNTEIGGMVSVVDFTNYDPIGDVYLFEDWRSGRLTLKNGVTTTSLVLRINLLNNSIDVKDKGKVRTFSIEKIEHVDIAVLSDSLVRYVNPNQYQFSDNTPVIGLLRKVTQGEKWTLIERNYLKIYEANYVKALDAGSKQDRYETTRELYMLNEGTIYPVLGSRRKFVKGLGLTESQAEGLLSYMKENKSSNKRHNDLYDIVAFLNSQE